MRRSVFAAAVGAALLLSGCGSTQASSDDAATSTGAATVTQTLSTATAATRTSTYTSPDPTATTASTPAATVSTATITRPDSGGAGLGTDTTTATATSECVAADLTPAAVAPNGATGTVVLGFTLRNRGAQACDTYGWPGIAFVDAAGSAVVTQTTRTTSDILGATPPVRFTIAPGGEASFRITVHDSNDQGGESGCGSFRTVQIIAPNDTATMRVTLPDGPAEVCGTAAISPLEPGTSATGQ